MRSGPSIWHWKNVLGNSSRLVKSSNSSSFLLLFSSLDAAIFSQILFYLHMFNVQHLFEFPYEFKLLLYLIHTYSICFCRYKYVKCTSFEVDFISISSWIFASYFGDWKYLKQLSGYWYVTCLFQAFAVAGTLKQNYANILLMLLRLRQACDHPLLVKGNQSEYGGDGSIEMAKQLPKEVVIDLLAKVEVGSALCTLCNVSILISHHHFGAHRFLSPFPFLGVIILIFVYYWMSLPPNIDSLH